MLRLHALLLHPLILGLLLRSPPPRRDRPPALHRPSVAPTPGSLVTHAGARDDTARPPTVHVAGAGRRRRRRRRAAAAWREAGQCTWRWSARPGPRPARPAGPARAWLGQGPAREARGWRYARRGGEGVINPPRGSGSTAPLDDSESSKGGLSICIYIFHTSLGLSVA